MKHGRNKARTTEFDEVVGQDLDWGGDTYYVEYRLFVRWTYDYECADADGNRGEWMWSEDERYIREVKKVERYHREDEPGSMTALSNPIPAGLQAAIEKTAKAYDAAGEMDRDDDDEEPPDREDR